LHKSPTWVPIYEIIEVIEAILRYENINEIKLILARLKIINILWELDINHENKTVWKILKYINNNRISEILRLGGIDEEVKIELEKI